MSQLAFTTGTMRVSAIEPIASTALRLTQTPTGATRCTTVEAGAHVDVHLPIGVVRQYSLLNFGEDQRYVIAVGLDASSRGGSAWIHQQLRAGDVLEVSAPRNHFPLHDSAEPALLIAGGIGITPLWCMVQALEARGLPWTLYHCARQEDQAPLLQELKAFASASRQGQLIGHFDQGSTAAMLDLRSVLSRHAETHHAYCCGPRPMLDAFVAAAASLSFAPDHVHTEYFNVESANRSTDTAFEVELNDGSRHRIAPGISILDTLLQAGLPLLYSCKEGRCGSCETSVLAGAPLHRDCVLSPGEQASNRSMMICVSRSLGPLLKLDI